MHDLKLLKACPDDKEFAFAVRKSAFSQYVEQSEGWDEEQQRLLHERRFACQDFRIITWRDERVGIVALDVADGCMKINQMLLLPQYQGKEIGSRCMRLIAQEAQELQLPMRLRVLKCNPRALAFYHRQGFSTTGETDSHYLLEKSPR